MTGLHKARQAVEWQARNAVSLSVLWLVSTELDRPWGVISGMLHTYLPWLDIKLPDSPWKGMLEQL